MISFYCNDGSTNCSNFCRTKEPMNERSQWMAWPILLIVATSVSQILWHNKCAKMTHGLMIHDYSLFCNATSVDALLYSTEITTSNTSIVARVTHSNRCSRNIYFKIFSCLLFFLHYVQRPTLIVILCKCSWIWVSTFNKNGK